jgi:DNA polymerase
MIGQQYYAGLDGRSTVIPDFDFETYSEAGYIWNESKNRWTAPEGTPKGTKAGLSLVGAACYSEHPSCEVITLSYNLQDGRGPQRWQPGLLPPVALFQHLALGGLLEAWNVGFERWIWRNVCMPKYGWPPLPELQLRCAMAKSRAHALPGKLDLAGQVLNLAVQKDKEGVRLIQKFCVPRSPTKPDPRRRIRPADDPIDAERFFSYCDTDIAAEHELSIRSPDLTGDELAFWQADQAINVRGVAIDLPHVDNCIALIREAHIKYDAELCALTGGAVGKASELAKLQAWLSTQGVHMRDMQQETIEQVIADVRLVGLARRALEIRSAVGSASVKKVFAMALQVARDGRLHDLFSYHAARTGRPTGNGPQPTNLPKAGPDVQLCKGCGHYHKPSSIVCPWCAMPCPPGRKPLEWKYQAVEDALAIIGGRNLALLEHVFGDAMATISGCLRGLFIAAPGHDLICSDYSAIEAVVIAALAGEEWRLEVFRTHGKIYEESIARSSGIPLAEILAHKETTGAHHPLRAKGKIQELSLGFGGWIGALKNFGADGADDELREQVLAWREASPAIVEFWGGQFRGLPWDSDIRPELYGLEGMAISAVLNPGTPYRVEPSGITFTVKADVLYMTLPSGRHIAYHRPRLETGGAGLYADVPSNLSLSYEGFNSNPLNGPPGWLRMSLYGGKIAENATQAVARDIQRHAIINLERRGYPVVLHVYDEDCCEVAEGFGSVAELEAIMMDLPPWAAGWPIKAQGGWRAKRYRKD